MSRDKALYKFTLTLTLLSTVQYSERVKSYYVLHGTAYYLLTV